MALRGRREPPSQSDGLGGPSYRFPQIVTALSIPRISHQEIITRSVSKAAATSCDALRFMPHIDTMSIERRT